MLENADWNFGNLSIDKQVDKTTQNIFNAAELSIPK